MTTVTQTQTHAEMVDDAATQHDEATPTNVDDAATNVQLAPDAHPDANADNSAQTEIRTTKSQQQSAQAATATQGGVVNPGATARTAQPQAAQSRSATNIQDARKSTDSTTSVKSQKDSARRQQMTSQPSNVQLRAKVDAKSQTAIKKDTSQARIQRSS